MLQCPHHGPTRPDPHTGALVVLVVLGFFTCGLTWFFTPLVPLARLVSPTCPVCGTALTRETRSGP